VRHRCCLSRPFAMRCISMIWSLCGEQSAVPGIMVSQILALFPIISSATACHVLTYCSWTVQHANIKVPQTQSTIFTNTPKSIIAVITPPWIKRHTRHPRLVSLTSGHKGPVGSGPNGDQIVLATSQDILCVRRPANAGQPSVI
jgi:hypothetical protein